MNHTVGRTKGRGVTLITQNYPKQVSDPVAYIAFIGIYLENHHSYKLNFHTYQI